jgi:AcrR family transcriptional regulator
VLDAAREAFAVEGLAVPLDEIARRAGVGAGTVYRHFPTKEALFEAVVVDRLEALTDVGRATLDRLDQSSPTTPGAEFFSFMTAMVADARAKTDLAEALIGAGVDLQKATFAAATDLRHVLGELLIRAQAAGAVRPDLDIADLHALAAGAIAAERRAEGDGRPGRLAQLIWDGMRPAGL